jgi:hypothetical protein
VTGTWNVAAKFSIKGGVADGESHDMTAVFALTQKGTIVTGTFTPYEADGKTAQRALPILDGQVAADKLTFKVKNDADSSLTFALVLVDGRLRGTATSTKEPGGGKLTITIDATRR